MNTRQSLTSLVPIPSFGLARFWRRRTPEGEAGHNAGPSQALRDALARENVLLRRMQSAMEEYELLRLESNHRLSNNLQIVVSLLMTQSRAATPESAPQLAAAALRVMAIERIQRRLHSNDGSEIVGFKNYLETFCADISGIMNAGEAPRDDILVACDDICLPTKITIPLGFVINELITNAIKYGNGNIRVRLEGRPNAVCALTVANDGPALPEGYDPATTKGLGMKIVRSFVRQIGGELHVGRDEGNQGAQFTVLFPDCRQIRKQ
jgi:two-component sensor histidine kinase